MRRCSFNDLYWMVAVLIGICCCIERISSFSIQHHPLRWTDRRLSPSTVSTLHHSSSSSYHSSSKYLPFQDCRTVEELVQLMYDNMNNSTPRIISTFWSSVPKRKSRFDKVQNIEQMNHQLNDILDHTLEVVNTFGYRHLAQTALGFAKIVKNVSGTDGKRLPRYGTPQRVLYDLIIGANSSNKEFIFKVLAASSINILRKFDARHLSNLIYAYGLAQVVIVEDDTTLFDVFAQAAIPNLNHFNSQDLSNMLWAYANVKEPQPQLFEQAGIAIVDGNNLNEFKPQELSNTLWAYATLNEQHTVLFKKVADHIVRLESLHNFKPQDISNIVLAFATAGESHPILFKRLAGHIISLDNLRSFNGQDCSNTMWAFATAGESHPQLFKNLADEAIKRQHEFNPQGIANFLWAFATNGQVDEHLFSSLAPSVKANLDEYTAQGLINVAWAYAVANVDAPSVFNVDFMNGCLRKKDGFIMEDFRQLHQWQLWQDEIKSNISLPESLQKRCYEAFVLEEPRPSMEWKMKSSPLDLLQSTCHWK